MSIIVFAAGPAAFGGPATATQLALLGKAVWQSAGHPAADADAAALAGHVAAGTLSSQLASAFLDGFHALPTLNPLPAQADLALAS